MSDATASATMRYQPLQGGDAESRWIRVEQERPEDEALTLDEAAEIIDALYDIQPCDEGGMSGGGEEATEEAPDEEKFDAAMRAMLRRSGVCKQAEYWLATVRVMRSHRQPGYVLRSETAEVETTTPVRESRRQYVEIDGATIELDMPYEGGLTGIPAGIRWTARGSTINLDRPLRGNLVLRYNTYYERVTLRVPTTITTAPGGLPSGITTGLPGAAATRTELPSAAVVAFWGDLAASCDLEPPDVDEGLSQDELDEICRRVDGGGSGGGIHDDSPNDCWRTVRHYSRCNCSRKKVNEYDTEEGAPCDGAASGSVVGARDSFHGFVICPDEEDEVNDPEYYKERCCKPQAGGLPRCRRSYDVYRGGAGIESGPEHWRKIYGADVAMIAVQPKGGTCGEVVTEWQVPSKNCCEDVEDLTPDPDNPTTIYAPGGAELLSVLGGRLEDPKRWRVSAGYTLSNGMSSRDDGGSQEWIIAGENACNQATIVVEDSCSRTTMTLRRENEAPAMVLDPQEAVVAPRGYVSVAAMNALGEVQWSSGQLRLLTPQGQDSATFQAPEDFCGTDTVVASDACGQMATMVVMSTDGRWEEIPGAPFCEAPWGGAAPAQLGGSCNNLASGESYLVENYKGYRAHVCVGGQATYEWTTYRTCETSGSCEEAVTKWAGSHPELVPCGYTGNALIAPPGGLEIFAPCNPDPWYTSVDCQPLCTHFNRCIRRSDGTPDRVYDAWRGITMTVTQLWEWVC